MRRAKNLNEEAPLVVRLSILLLSNCEVLCRTVTERFLKTTIELRRTQRIIDLACYTRLVAVSKDISNNK